jgi:hypothetical protein
MVYKLILNSEVEAATRRQGISLSDSNAIFSCIDIRWHAWMGEKCSSWAKKGAQDVIGAHGDSASLTLSEQRM